MFVSVVIPAYNSEKCINRAIDSVLAQTFKNFEIIVVDDGSSDRTGEVLKQYANLVQYIYQENQGVCVARNRGIEESDGNWVAFLDHDDEWSPDKLARQVGIIRKNPQLSWCATNYSMNDGQKCTPVRDPEKISKHLNKSGFFESYLRAEGSGIIRLMPTAVMIRREVFDKVGRFDETLKRSEDTDLWCRIALTYPAIGFVPEAVATRYLDIKVSDDVIKLRIEQKSGGPMRKVLGRYFDRAKETGRLVDYNLFAANELRKIVYICLYNGYGKEVLITISDFKNLFSWHWRMGVRIMATLPLITKAFLHLAAYMAYILRLDRKASRRFLYPKKSSIK